MSESKYKISDEQKQQLIQAIVTLITVLVSIAMTLATQAVTDLIDGPGEPVEPGESVSPLEIPDSASFPALPGKTLAIVWNLGALARSWLSMPVTSFT